MGVIFLAFSLLAALVVAAASPTNLLPNSRNVSQALFNSLEELARVVDIAYCVGSTGIQKPFRCLSRCGDFPGFELVSSWHTGPLLSDSCGYIAISHSPHSKRIIVAFRGTYSIANTIADLSTIPAEYVPFPGDGGQGDDMCDNAEEDHHSSYVKNDEPAETSASPKCEGCTVHLGFLASWKNTRCIIIPDIEHAISLYPDYKLTLVGHSLGGAVAALASLEFQTRGWQPQVTTFGEPRIGNQALNTYIDKRFNLTNTTTTEPSNIPYRRITHINDPVPLLPPEEWGFGAHAGEIFISKLDLPPTMSDLQHCDGDEDQECIAGSGTGTSRHVMSNVGMKSFRETRDIRNIDLGIPTRFKLWELFFAHRDYFWRLGLCVPGQWEGGRWSPPLDQSPITKAEEDL